MNIAQKNKNDTPRRTIAPQARLHDRFQQQPGRTIRPKVIKMEVRQWFH